MAATLIDGKALAAKLKKNVLEEVQVLPRKPGLAVILVGDDPASRVYVTSKRKDCEECGFYSEEYALPAETTQKQLLELVGELNGREDIDGILEQLPLPKGLECRLRAVSQAPTPLFGGGVRWCCRWGFGNSVSYR